VLAQLACGTMRGKIARLEEALDCSFLTEEHAAVLSMMLSLIDCCTAQINELTAKICAAAASAGWPCIRTGSVIISATPGWTGAGPRGT